MEIIAKQSSSRYEVCSSRRLSKTKTTKTQIRIEVIVFEKLAIGSRNFRPQIEPIKLACRVKAVNFANSLKLSSEFEFEFKFRLPFPVPFPFSPRFRLRLSVGVDVDVVKASGHSSYLFKRPLPNLGHSVASLSGELS